MIRKATEADLESIKKMVEELEEQVFDFDKFKEIYLINLLNSEVHYFVAEVEMQVVGFMSLFESKPLHHCERLVEIQELIINEKYRGLNVGKEFMQLAEELGKEKKWLQIELSSNLKRLKAHGFYIRNGFIRGHYKFVKRLK
jgi:PhnO protein